MKQTPTTNLHRNASLISNAIFFGISILLMFSMHRTHPIVGCMDDSMNSARYNTHEYHFVQCNCPCTKRIAKQDRCLQCGHAHNPQPLTIITKPDMPKSKNARIKAAYNHQLLEQTPDTVMQSLFKKHKKQ